MSAELTPLETAFRAAFDNRPLPPPPDTPNLGIPFRKILRNMNDKTNEQVRRIASEMRHWLFALTPGQWQTLEQLDIDDRASEFLSACHYRLTYHEHYAVNRRLHTISSVPEHPADWSLWWLEQSREHIGVSRPQDHDPKQEPVSETLNGVILRITQAALPNLPDVEQIAAYIGQNPDLWLSAVYAATGAVISLAKRLGAHQEAQERYRLSPDTLSARMDAAGIRHTKDMGILEHPARLRQQPHWPGIAQVYCSRHLNIWWRRDDDHAHDILDHAMPPGVFAGLRDFSHPITADAGPSPAEQRLIVLTTPRPVEDNFGKLETLACHYGLTPAQTQALLDGKDIEITVPPLCPQAGNCPAICGRLQQTGEMAFPITAAGGYENCRYYQFLAAHGEQDPDTRAMHARRLVDRIGHRNGRATPRPPEPETEQTETTAPVVQQTVLAL